MVEIKLSFTSIDEAISFLSDGRSAVTESVTTPLKPAKTKHVKAEEFAAMSPTVAAEPATAAPITAVELPYAPIAERIAKLVAISHPRSAVNRTAVKAFFAGCEVRYGIPVKTGQAVKAEDRPALVAVLDGIEAEESVA